MHSSEAALGEMEGTEVGEVEGAEVSEVEGIKVGLDVGLSVVTDLERQLSNSKTQGSALLHVFLFLISSQTPRNKEQGPLAL